MTAAKTILKAFTNTAQDISLGVQATRQSISELREKMKEYPQVRTAVIHCATYASCLIIPAAVGIYLSVKHDGTPNIWRVPDGSEKIEFIEPNSNQ